MRLTPLAIAPLCACLCAAALGAQAPTQITHEQVSVAATNDEWTSTGTTVAVGDLFIVEAEGRITVGRGLVREVGPAGGAGGAGQLMLKIGTGAPQRAGTGTYVRATEAGQVKFRINDNRYTDNAGSYTVRVIHIPASVIPPPKIE